MKTIFEQPFLLKDKQCLLFFETVGLEETTDFITLTNISYNHDGKGQILQLFNEDGESERDLLASTIDKLQRFDLVYTTWPWFEKYINARVTFRHLPLLNNVTSLNIPFPEFYGNGSINVMARKSIDLYRRYLEERDPQLKTDYHTYNRNHTLRFFAWAAQHPTQYVWDTPDLHISRRLDRF